MNDEKKEYSIVGTVTIGTDEYRDLLTEKFEALRDKEEYYNKWYKLYQEIGALERKNKELTAKLEQLNQYLEDTDAEDKFELWLVKMSRKD